MGDNNAVELGQKSHMKLALLTGAIDPSELLSTHGRAPRSTMAGGIVIDDVILAQCRDPTVALEDGASEGALRLRRLFEEYAQRGLTPHPTKTFSDETKAEFWGCLVDGRVGLARPNPKRIIPLIQLTLQTARLGIGSVGILEVLAGAWVAALQIKRRLLSLWCWWPHWLLPT